MKIHFSYLNFEKNKCVQKLEEYATEEKLKGLARLLGHGNFSLADFDIRAEYMTHHNAFLVRLNLKVAKHILTAQEAKHSLTEAFDLALEKLERQLRRLENKRHKTQVKPL